MAPPANGTTRPAPREMHDAGGEGHEIRSAVRASALALALRGLAVLALVELTGPGLARAFTHVHPLWIAAVAAAALATYPAYVLAYASVIRANGRPAVSLRTLVRIVLAGFGPLAVSGGFAIDTRAWRSLAGDRAMAGRPARTMAALEWAVLAPGAWVAAVTLLARGSSVPGTLLWPWAIGVPTGLACVRWLGGSGVSDWFMRLCNGRARRLLIVISEAALAMRAAPRPSARLVLAGAAMCVYWAAEIGAFDAAAHAAGLGLGPGSAVIAYATGYLASRRSLPLGGAGLAELLLVYALHEMHARIGPAVAAVLIYRMFNFVLVVIPALWSYAGLEASLRRVQGHGPG